MHDQQPRHALEHPRQRLLDHGFRVHVNGGERVVEHQNRRSSEHRPRQREPLPLPAGQCVALLTHARLEAPRQVPDETRLRHLDRALELLVRHDRPAHDQVLVDRRREQDRVFERKADVRAERTQRDLTYVYPVQQHGTLADVVQARREVGKRRLSAARPADQSHRFVRLDHQVQPAEDPVVRIRISEPDVPKLEPPA